MKVITNLSAKKNLSFQKQDTACLWKHIQYCLALTILKDFVKINFNAGTQIMFYKERLWGTVLTISQIFGSIRNWLVIFQKIKEPNCQKFGLTLETQVPILALASKRSWIFEIILLLLINTWLKFNLIFSKPSSYHEQSYYLSSPLYSSRSKLGKYISSRWYFFS